MTPRRTALALVTALLIAPTAARADPPPPAEGNRVMVGSRPFFNARRACIVSRPNGSARNQLVIALSARDDLPCPQIASIYVRGTAAMSELLVLVVSRNPTPGAGTYRSANAAQLQQQLSRQAAAMPSVPPLPSDRPPTPEEIQRMQAAAQQAAQLAQNVQGTLDRAPGVVNAVFLNGRTPAFSNTATVNSTVTIATHTPQLVEGTFTIEVLGAEGAGVYSGSFRAPLTVDPRGD